MNDKINSLIKAIFYLIFPNFIFIIIYFLFLDSNSKLSYAFLACWFSCLWISAFYNKIDCTTIILSALFEALLSILFPGICVLYPFINKDLNTNFINILFFVLIFLIPLFLNKIIKWFIKKFKWPKKCLEE